MADNIRGVPLGDDEPHLDLRPLMRLGAWGACAFVALAVVVFAGRSDIGERRAGMAFASLTGSPTEQSLRLTGAELLARAEAEREARRTTEALRTLAADRDRLANRVATLERNIEDLTGSIKRQPEPPRQVPQSPPTTAAPTSAGVAAAPPNPPIVTAQPSPQIAAAPPVADAPTTTASRKDTPPPGLPLLIVAPKEPPSPAPPAAETALPPPPPAAPPLAPAIHVARPGPIALIQSYATATSPLVAPPPPTPPAPIPQPAANDAAAASVAAHTEFAVDLGAASSVNGLRALWDKTRARQPAQLEGLRPLISVRDGQRPGSTELRLVAGPLANASAAARLCAALVATGTHCQPAVFDGQRLALR